MYESLLQRIEEIITPILGQLGLHLVEREFLQEYGRWILRLYIDKPEGGVTIDHCQEASRVLGSAIDVEGMIDRTYTLEVSSPGIDRPLRTEEDFCRFVGSNIRLKTKYPLEGRSHYKGILKRFENGNIYMEIDEKEYCIPHQSLHRARLIGEVTFGGKH
ncbi:MAG: hypothetical protein A3I05_10070 [Deltaproteobacteria bacterium RIFCSPLOWO2_02_FULL_44_10]|nr:MAG: hypothetical protein A3C46_08910 [Deltaproteobacteria bacterium RIFCSPHIGHO2_02_FULL_44_16]OGQ45893.1 MAG: hypothetical protein A3I05_10070 [Deltaproteobacteria bacterium RIFCSPLOWO2_02_FULL_44_10]